MKEVVSPLLAKFGLNMFAVFNLESLPQTMLEHIKLEFGDMSSFNQIFIFGHGGKTMWQALQQSAFANKEHPIDNFSKHVVTQYFEKKLSNHHYQFIYPHEQQHIPLRQLGELAGWHHPSPFKVGINATFGTWFAYRAVVLADTKLTTTTPINASSPCDNCQDKPCISLCPASALEAGDLSLPMCLDYRSGEKSKCKNTCLSRLSCPIAKEHRYSKEQMQYHYDVSMHMIKTYHNRATCKSLGG